MVAVLGFLSGLRSLTPLALVCWIANWGWIPLVGSRLAFLGTTTGAIIVSILALGELMADKLPQTPSRTDAAPLIARMITGGLCGAAVCLAAGQTWLLGVFCGVVGSVVGAFAGYHARRLLVQRFRVPDLMVALAEDCTTIAGTLVVFAATFTKSG